MAIVFVSPALSAVYQIGSGKQYEKISALLLAETLGPGDIVEIYQGTYNEANELKPKTNGTKDAPIIVRGIGSQRPVIDGTGIALSGTPDSLFMIKGSNIVIENLEFRNGGVNDGGSGIRIFGRNVTVRNCKIAHCALGISSSSGASNTIVEYTEITDCINYNPNHWGHSVYMNSDSIFRYCHIHDSGKGHNFKTRGHYTELLYNYICDANSAEVDIVDSGESARPDSNAVLIGNIIRKRDAKPKSGYGGNPTQFIVFGQDTGGKRKGTIYIINNTIIGGEPENRVIWLNSPETKAVFYNNIIYGTDNIAYDEFTAANMTGSNNWFPETASIPSGFTGTLLGKDPGFVDISGKDFHLSKLSKCINAGSASPSYTNGRGNTVWGLPAFEYIRDLKSIPRPAASLPDLGAYEYVKDASKE